MKLNLIKDLGPLRSEKLAQIDADAIRALERYRTSSDYASAVYALKRDELSAYDAGATSAERLRLMSAEAKAVGTSLADLAGTWRVKMLAEDDALPRIEAQRQALKQAVRAARTPAEIERIVAGASWD